MNTRPRRGYSFHVTRSVTQDFWQNKPRVFACGDIYLTSGRAALERGAQWWPRTVGGCSSWLQTLQRNATRLVAPATPAALAVTTKETIAHNNLTPTPVSLFYSYCRIRIYFAFDLVYNVTAFMPCIFNLYRCWTGLEGKIKCYFQCNCERNHTFLTNANTELMFLVRTMFVNPFVK
jgi:hypothetical protein